MSDYIKREDAIEALAEHLKWEDDEEGFGTLDLDDCRYIAKKQLESVPSADVVEVRHGRWEGKTYKCSICGKWIDPLQGDADMNYCPNCGAKMDGGNDE